MTEREKLAKFMRRQGFSVSSFEGQPFQGTLELTPSCRKAINGDTHLIARIRFVMFGGSNCEHGDLGCVVFYFSGKTRMKYHRRGHNSEILKKSFCPKTAQEAKEAFKVWKQKSYETMDSWQLLL